MAEALTAEEHKYSACSHKADSGQSNNKPFSQNCCFFGQFGLFIPGID